MTESHDAIHESRGESADGQRDAGDETSGNGHRFALSCLGAVALSAVGSLVTAGMLPARVRIHWTLGLGPYYGPEFAPTPLVLTVFPVVIGATACSGYWIASRGEPSDTVPTRRPFSVVTVLGMLTALLGIQGVLIVANL